MTTPKDPSSLVGLLQCKDGTAVVAGKRNHDAEFEAGITRGYAGIQLTREAGAALREMLDEWLAVPRPAGRAEGGE